MKLKELLKKNQLFSKLNAMNLTIIFGTILFSVLLAIILLPVFICYEFYKKFDYKKIKILYQLWIGNL